MFCIVIVLWDDVGSSQLLVLPPRTLVFDDAQVEAWHEDHPDELIDQGGAFSSRGPFTLTNSYLTASWIVWYHVLVLHHLAK